MLNYYMKLTIKQKLYVIVSLVILGLFGLYLENSVNQNNVSNLVNIKSELKDLQISMLQLRRTEKDFLLRKDIKYGEKFNVIFNQSLQIVKGLEQRLANTDISSKKLSAMKISLQVYQQAFEQLIEVSVEKGLDKDSGVYGKLRAATHELESSLKAAQDFESNTLLLTLRRHEKDFILRNDEKYLGRLLATAEKLTTRLEDANTKQLLVTYKVEKRGFVAICVLLFIVLNVILIKKLSF